MSWWFGVVFAKLCKPPIIHIENKKPLGYNAS